MQRITAATLLLIACTAAGADDTTPDLGWYLGLGGGHSLLEPDMGKTGFELKEGVDTAWKVYGGYHFTNAIAVEAEYADLGTAVLDPWGSVDYRVMSLSGLYYVFEPGNPLTLGWSLFGRAGIAKISNTSDVPYELDHPASLHYGFGGAWRINNNWSVRFDTTTYDDDAALTSASIVYYFVSRPAPVAEPAPPPPPVAVVTAPADSDGDGIADPRDTCPGTPAGARVDENGCEIDSDGDGVSDSEDQCPGTPPGAVVNEWGCIPDNDQDDDGVTDDKDECPNTPAGVQVDEQGCDPDPDQDGVPRKKDKCPATPRGMKVNKDGCTTFQSSIRNVHFKSGSSELDVDARSILDGVARELKMIPHVKIEIQAHTDSRGSDEFNLKLSQRRADSVHKYLLAHGISPNRLTARGYGESRPMDSNDTPEGRANNRRVELQEVR